MIQSLLLPVAVLAQAPRAELDHIILAINNLDRGIEQFVALTGVTPEKGGRHPGRNTQNALVSLGNGAYLEILAPADDVPNPDAVITYRDLLVGGWALHGNLDALLTSLTNGGFSTVGPTPGSRQKPDGRMLEWRTGGATGAGLSLAPFLIEWSAGSVHPSRTAPTGCRLDRIEVREDDPGPLTGFFSATGFSIAVTKGVRGVVVTLTCRKGKVTFATMI